MFKYKNFGIKVLIKRIFNNEKFCFQFIKSLTVISLYDKCIHSLASYFMLKIRLSLVEILAFEYVFINFAVPNLNLYIKILNNKI